MRCVGLMGACDLVTLFGLAVGKGSLMVFRIQLWMGLNEILN